jgi:hypothetical protein
MATIKNKVLSGTGSFLYACDWMQEPFLLSTFVNPTATGTFGLQYTFDDVMNVPPANVRWLNDTNIPAGTTAAKNTSYNFPITALQLVITASTGPIEWKILQS